MGKKGAPPEPRAADEVLLRAGLRGTVLGYATPDIQRHQAWATESYYVRLDCDSPDSLGRVLDVDRLRPI